MFFRKIKTMCYLMSFLNINFNLNSTVQFQESNHALKCQYCPQQFADLKSLQIHSFLDHHRHDSRSLTPPNVLNLTRHTSPRPENLTIPGNVVLPRPDNVAIPSSGHGPVSCHICSLKLPNQAIFQQVQDSQSAFGSIIMGESYIPSFGST